MKTEVYSWRVSPALKSELEEAAREERVSVAMLLERIAREWLKGRDATTGRDEAEQERLRAAAARYIGSIAGDDPDRSQRVRERVTEQLARKYPR